MEHMPTRSRVDHPRADPSCARLCVPQGDGKKIDGRRVLVDVERGRTVRNWRPRRLGGGLGSTRATGAAIKNSGRDVGGGGGGSSHHSQGGGGGYSGHGDERGGGSRSGLGYGGGSSRPSEAGGKLTWTTERRDSDRERPRGDERRRDDRRDDRRYDERRALNYRLN